jgi:hypothetical protein
MRKDKRTKNIDRLVELLLPKDSERGLPPERRYPFPGRNKLPTSVDWERLGPTAVGTTSSNRRRRRQRLIPIDNETRERIIQDLRSRGIID